MPIPLRVLIIEDSDSDAALDVRELERAGYKITHEIVSTAKEMKAVLHTQTFDLIISDHNLPQFDSLKALGILKESGLDIPFIVVSGTIGEETAVKIMKAGAHDYVMKGNLSRLGTAVERELREVEVRCKHRQAEEAFKESEQRYRTLFESSAEGMLIADIEANKFKYANPAICRMLGYSQEELTKMSVSDIHPKASLETVFADFAAQARGEKISSSGLPCLKKDGTIIYADINAARAIIDGRECNIGFFTDITERKKAEETLRQSAENYRELAESISDIFFAMDADLRYIYWNKASEKLTGIAAKDVLGKHLYDIFPDVEATKRAEKEYLKTIETQQPQHFVNDYRLGDKDFVFDISAYPTQTGVSVFVKDITEQRKMQEQLILTDRLASIGQLVSGIAHELNNPLTGVIGFSDLLLERDFPDDVKEDLETINREAKRTANVVKGLLTFVRKQGTEKTPVDINSIIQGILQLRSYEQRVSNIEVDNRFTSDLPQVIGNGAQLQQVFINLIVNAEQAMLETHGRGRLTITTERVGDIVRTSVTDDGPGISPENMRKLFTPFFTTKEVGKGTGLGLSICHGILTEHGGKIYAESEPGKGATFVVELPISK